MISPITPAVIMIFLFISAGSISNCRIFACCANFFGISSHTVAEPGTHHDQKIALADSVVGCLGSMHSQHSGIKRIRSREMLLFPSGNRRPERPVSSYKFAQFFTGTGKHGAAAHENIRLFGLFDHLAAAVSIPLLQTSSGFGNDSAESFWFILCLIRTSHLLEYQSSTGPGLPHLCNPEMPCGSYLPDL